MYVVLGNTYNSIKQCRYSGVRLLAIALLARFAFSKFFSARSKGIGIYV